MGDFSDASSSENERPPRERSEKNMDYGDGSDTEVIEPPTPPQQQQQQQQQNICGKALLNENEEGEKDDNNDDEAFDSTLFFSGKEKEMTGPVPFALVTKFSNALDERRPENMRQAEAEKRTARRIAFGNQTRFIDTSEEGRLKINVMNRARGIGDNNGKGLSYEDAINRLHLSFRNWMKDRYAWLEKCEQELFKQYHDALVKENIEKARESNELTKGMNALFIRNSGSGSAPSSPMSIASPLTPPLSQKRQGCACGAAVPCQKNCAQMSFPVVYLSPFNPFGFKGVSLFVASATARAFLADGRETCWDKWDESATQGRLLYESFHGYGDNHSHNASANGIQGIQGIQGLGDLFQMIGLCAEISFGNLDPAEIQSNRRAPVRNGTRLYRLWELILPMVTNDRAAAIIQFPASQTVFCIIRDRMHDPRMRLFACDNLPMPWDPFPAIIDLDLDSKLEPLLSFIIQNQGQGQGQGQSQAQTAFEFAKIQLVASEK